ncbi:MAG: LysR family transcriptional regulator [Nocardioides sp.]
MDLDLRLVRYFVAVADELHFGRAAARLFVSQPALSKQIRKLEGQLGEPLLVRDSRRVALTVRGQRFYDDAQRLLEIAERMQRPVRPEGIRLAHIFELSTSRDVCDAFAQAYPGVPMLEHALDSLAQLTAVLENRLDVGMLRVTPDMIRDHPNGWRHRLLRLEPLVVVGGTDDPAEDTASLVDQPLGVFGDPVESGTYNAYGTYLSALEQDLGIAMNWLGTPGAFSHCLAHVRRLGPTSRHLDFFSYAERYAAAGVRVRRPRECQPYYPWSLVWRADDTSAATADFVTVALQFSAARGWLDLPTDHAPPWLPADEPVREEALGEDDPTSARAEASESL